MPVQTSAQWYNRDRVQQPGSVVLRDWIARRPGADVRAGSQFRISDREAMQEIFQVPSLAGPAVTPTTAMQVSTVYACIALICGAIASLPLQLLRAHRRSRTAASASSTTCGGSSTSSRRRSCRRAVFWEYILATRFLHGDGFALLIRNRAGGDRPRCCRSRRSRSK
jgi:phage portal protein BeeE